MAKDSSKTGFLSEKELRGGPGMKPQLICNTNRSGQGWPYVTH